MTFSPNHELEPTAMSPRVRGLPLGAVAQLYRSTLTASARSTNATYV